MDPALEHVLRGALALLLGSGALHKLRDRADFRVAVLGYALLPPRTAGAAADAIAAGEALLALVLLTPAWLGVRVPALTAAAALFALYGAAIAINLARGRREIDCGCGGFAARVPLSGWLLARNGVLAAAALACAGGIAARPLVAVDGLTIAGGIAILTLVWIAGHGLLAHSAALPRAARLA